jgi:hypothetical protein
MATNNKTEKIQKYVSPGRLLYNKYLGKLFYYVGDVGTIPTVQQKATPSRYNETRDVLSDIMS